MDGGLCARSDGNAELSAARETFVTCDECESRFVTWKVRETLPEVKSIEANDSILTSPAAEHLHQLLSTRETLQAKH